MRAPRFRRVAGAVAVGWTLLAVLPSGAGAQGVEESRLLREASTRESTGDFDGAESIYRRILEGNPTSQVGLFGLERVLRGKGEIRSLLPAVDAFLAKDPGAAGVRHLKLRVLASLDSMSAVEDEAERWFREQPRSLTAYREVAAILERTAGPQRALEVLERGRRATGAPSDLALEMGDVLAAMGRREPALREWAQAVGDDGGQAALVSRRVAGLTADPDGAARFLVGLLGDAPQPGRKRAAVQIALDMKLAEEALDLSRRTVSGLEDRPRTAFLADVARRARDAGLGEVASWAYAELGQEAGSPAERRQFDQRLVEISLAAGDTAEALEAQRRVVSSFTTGSVDHRRARALELRLQGVVVPPETARAALEAFRDEFPQAPELDGLAAEVARSLLARGDAEGAEAVLEGMAGPRASLERGYLLLAGERPDEARRAFLMALPGLEPSEATTVIQFVSLLARLSPAGGGVLARAEALARQGRGEEAASSVTEALAALPEEDRPPLLAEAARLADRTGGTAQGAALRRRLLEEYPGSPESAEGALLLARYRAGEPDGKDEAIRILEELVVGSPEAPVVPHARRELERLRRSR